jgi:phenylalanyl-tRNA synthetase beta chain
MEVIELINKYNSTLIKEAFIFDVFEDSKIGPDKKSLSISLLFGANDRTLEDKEVSDEMNEILLKVQKEISMEIRE